MATREPIVVPRPDNSQVIDILANEKGFLYGTPDRPGTGFAISNPYECDDFSHLIGLIVSFENVAPGKVWVVKSVERFMHCPPWRRGERIALYCEEKKND